MCFNTDREKIIVDYCCEEGPSSQSPAPKRTCLVKSQPAAAAAVPDIFSVCVPVLCGTRRAVLSLSLGDTVAVLKEGIENTFGVPVPRQTLLCGGRELREHEGLYKSAPFNTINRYVVVVSRV